MGKKRCWQWWKNTNTCSILVRRRQTVNFCAHLLKLHSRDLSDKLSLSLENNYIVKYNNLVQCWKWCLCYSWFFKIFIFQDRLSLVHFTFVFINRNSICAETVMKIFWTDFVFHWLCTEPKQIIVLWIFTIFACKNKQYLCKNIFETASQSLYLLFALFRTKANFCFQLN
jgi:hypothetical protein